MAASVNTSGSQTAVIDTEHDLATVTAAGTFQLVVDAAAMVDGDTLHLRLYGKARSADTERLLYHAVFSQTLSVPLLASIPAVSPHHCKATLEQTAGTGRAFPWAIYSL